MIYKLWRPWPAAPVSWCLQQIPLNNRHELWSNWCGVDQSFRHTWASLDSAPSWMRSPPLAVCWPRRHVRRSRVAQFCQEELQHCQICCNAQRKNSKIINSVGELNSGIQGDPILITWIFWPVYPKLLKILWNQQTRGSNWDWEVGYQQLSYPIFSQPL